MQFGGFFYSMQYSDSQNIVDHWHLKEYHFVGNIENLELLVLFCLG